MQSAPLLQDRVVIVTGGSQGIGRSFAIGCAAQGAKVVIADVREAAETVTAVEQQGSQALYVPTDVTDEKATQRMAAETVRAFGRIDGLINNAAYFREVSLIEFEKLSVELWDTIFAVNVRGPFLCCKAVISTMRAQGAGSIVNISSATAVGGAPRFLHYVSTKGALLGFTKALAKEVGEHGVRVNAIAPGFVLTDATQSRPSEWREYFREARALKREEVPEDVVGTALYLLSDLSGFVTGQTIVVDGGHFLH
jgi:3-oxoacyl-[acyl-carrier protein] reductase